MPWYSTWPFIEDSKPSTEPSVDPQVQPSNSVDTCDVASASSKETPNDVPQGPKAPDLPPAMKEEHFSPGSALATVQEPEKASMESAPVMSDRDDDEPRKSFVVDHVALPSTASVPSMLSVDARISDPSSAPKDASENHAPNFSPTLRPKSPDPPIPILLNQEPLRVVSRSPTTGFTPPPSATSRTLAGTSDRPVSRQTHDQALQQWAAFASKQKSIVNRLSEVTQIRRQCIQIRKRAEYRRARDSMARLSGEPGTVDVDERDIEDADKLQELDLHLEELDEQLVRDSHDLHQAAPRVLNDMKKRLPIMLEKHLIEFRGDASTSSRTSTVEADEDLDPIARELIRNQQEVNELEDKILSLRYQRTRHAEFMAFDAVNDEGIHEQDRWPFELLEPLDPFAVDTGTEIETNETENEDSEALVTRYRDAEPEQEAKEQQQKSLEFFDNEISATVEKLRARRAEVEHSLNVSRTPEAELLTGLRPLTRIDNNPPMQLVISDVQSETERISAEIIKIEPAVP